MCLCIEPIGPTGARLGRLLVCVYVCMYVCVCVCMCVYVVNPSAPQADTLLFYSCMYACMYVCDV